MCFSVIVAMHSSVVLAGPTHSTRVVMISRTGVSLASAPEQHLLAVTLDTIPTSAPH